MLFQNMTQCVPNWVGRIAASLRGLITKPCEKHICENAPKASRTLEYNKRFILLGMRVIV
jgi:hypothetical protein